MKQLGYILVFILGISSGFSQTASDTVLTLEEYLGYVKKHHPIVKQAQLLVAEGEAKLLKARGGFDPKIEVDYGNKDFKNKTYYKTLNTAFKIPTWYGVALKANYENNTGTYLNPEAGTPNNGLYSAGVSVDLAKGLFINERMATLKQAKLYTQISEAKQQLLVNDILYNAVNTYFLWLKNYQQYQVYDDYKGNAKTRLQNVIKSFKAGDKAQVDTLEANINYKNRVLDLEKAKIGFIKSTLDISNYLWLDNNVPIELNANMRPDDNTFSSVDAVLRTSITNINDDIINNHPKIRSLQLQQQQLIIDRRLKSNNLLPKINGQYNFLTSDANNFNSLNTSNYKAGLAVSLPLFLRKERGDLKLAKLKLQDIDFEMSATKVSLQNKIKAIEQQMASYALQNDIATALVNDYKTLVKAEERKFNLGEGSLFLINYREAKLIETELKSVNIQYDVLQIKVRLMQLLNTLD